MREDMTRGDASIQWPGASWQDTDGSPAGFNLVIDHLDEFVGAITCACSTVADYITETPATLKRD